MVAGVGVGSGNWVDVGCGSRVVGCVDVGEKWGVAMVEEGVAGGVAALVAVCHRQTGRVDVSLSSVLAV